MKLGPLLVFSYQIHNIGKKKKKTYLCNKYTLIIYILWDKYTLYSVRINSNRYKQYLN